MYENTIQLLFTLMAGKTLPTFNAKQKPDGIDKNMVFLVLVG